MSSRIKGITIEIGGDVTKLDKALSGTNKKINETQNALKDVERRLKMDPGNTELLAQKQRLLADSVTNTKEKFELLREVASRSDDALARGQAYEAKYAPLKAEIDEISASLDELQSKQAQMEKKLKSGEITVEEYEKYQAEVKETKQHLDNLKKAKKELDEEFKGEKFDQSQYDAIQREFSQTTQELKYAETALRSCASGMDELDRKAKSVSDTAGKVSSAFKPVTQAVGRLGAAAIATVPLTEDLRADLSMLDNNAKQVGVGIDAARAAFEKLYGVSGETDSSIEAVSNLLQTGFTESNLQLAVEGLANAASAFPDTIKIESLADSLQETVATGRATEQFAEVLDRMEINVESFNETLATIPDETNKMEFALSQLISGPLAGYYDAWAKDNEVLLEGRDANLEMQQSLAELAENIQPFVTQITELATSLLGWFNSLDSGTQKFIGGFALLLGAISPVAGAVSGLAGTIGTVSKLLGGLGGTVATSAGSVSGLSTAFGGIGTVVSGAAKAVFSFLAGPVGISMLAVAAAGSLIYLWETNDQFQNTLIGFDEWITGVFTKDWSESFGFLGEGLNAFFANVSNMYEAIKRLLGGIVDFVAGIFTADWERAWQGVADIFGGIIDTLVAIVKAPINAVIGLINSLIQGITDGLNTVIRLLNNLSFNVPDWVPVIGGETFGLNIPQISAPQIPYLANGGVLTKPTTVVAGEYPGASQNPEIVAPYSMIKQANMEAYADMGRAMGGEIKLRVEAAPGMARYLSFEIENIKGLRGTSMVKA